MKTITAALTAAVATLGGAVAAVVVVPSATASQDPCTASEVARTVGSVVKSVGDYLDSHPETNQAATSVLQRPAGPESIGTLNAYFGANPKVQSDLATVAEPLTGLTMKCQLPVSIPQMLGFMQAAQAQAGLPGGLGGAAAQPPTGPQRIPADAPPMVVR